MSTSTAKTQLARQWVAIRDSVGSLVWRLPARQRPLNCPGIAPFRQQTPLSAPSRPLQTSRPFSSASKVSANRVKRSCTSGGLLLLTLSSPSSSTQTVVASCAAAADSALGGGVAQKPSIACLARQAWQRSIHSGSRGRGAVAGPRSKNSKATGEEGKPSSSQKDPNVQRAASEAKPNPQDPDPQTITNSMSKYLQSHLPHLPIPHRPTKEELLAAATGFWQRLKVRFKWFSIRSMRPWNADEWGAFVSLFMLGHLVWILLGTTFFFSLVIFTVNTVFAQEELAKWIGDYLTQSAGITVVFESAIVPRWKDGVISFRNVFVSRRPGQVKSSVKKGSSSTAAAMAAAKAPHDQMVDEDDGNYTQFDVTINTVNVTLSFIKWWNGTGLLKDVEVKGVRGVVDRTSVQWTGEQVDPLSYRHEHQPGDFEIEHFRLEDLLVTVHQPSGFRPFPVSIYSCELPQLRKQWLFYDFLSANHMSGSYDGSLFTIHPRQIQGVSASDDRPVVMTDGMGEPSAWKKFSRLRIDGLKIDHLNRGVEGPFGWIYEGNVDIVGDVMFPADAEEGIGKVVSDFYDKLEEAVTSNRYLGMLDNVPRDKAQVDIDNAVLVTSDIHGASKPSSAAASPLPAPATIPEMAPKSSPLDEIPRYLVMDLRLHLNDVRAAVPFFPASDSLGHTRTQSYINAALIRPIVAYINTKRTYIPITCRIVKRASDFDGSWGVYDCGLMDDSSAEVYAAFARDVEDQHSRVRRLKKVGFWTLSMVVHALLAGVAGDLM